MMEKLIEDLQIVLDNIADAMAGSSLSIVQMLLQKFAAFFHIILLQRKQFLILHYELFMNGVLVDREKKNVQLIKMN